MPDIEFLHADNDFLASMTMTVPAGTPASGLTMTCIVSASKAASGAQINAALNPTIAEVGTTGVYQGTIQGSAITAHLIPAYANQLVYLIWRTGTDFAGYRTCLVRDSRLAE